MAKTKAPLEPCSGCPREKARPTIEARPRLAPDPKLLVVSGTPDGVNPRTAGGDQLYRALRAAGLDPNAQVSYYTLVRCGSTRAGGWVEPRELASTWDDSVKHCKAFLQADLGAAGDLPVLALGLAPFVWFNGKGDEAPRWPAYRGTWMQTKTGRRLFATRHPSDIAAVVDVPTRNELLAQFHSDVRSCVDSVLGRKEDSGIDTRVYESPVDAQHMLRWLAEYEEPWAFDIEAYDAAEFPSRRDVSTNPFHPDFRVRGVAFAVSAWEGFYVDLKGWEGRPEARRLLEPVFSSPAVKRAFHGNYDHEGLVYTGWVPEVRNRSEDGMLAWLAISDGTHESLRLEKAVVDVLRLPQYWGEGLDKGMMRDLPLKVVGENAVYDACHTFSLCDVLHARLAREDYMSWRSCEQAGH